MRSGQLHDWRRGNLLDTQRHAGKHQCIAITSHPQATDQPVYTSVSNLACASFALQDLPFDEAVEVSTW